MSGSPITCPECQSHCEAAVGLRPVDRQDINTIYRWRNTPDIYRWFYNQSEPLDWHEHVEWIQSRPPAHHDLMIEHRGTPVGVVSIDEDGAVGIYIGEKRLWGQGIATHALTQAIHTTDRHELTARIHTQNTTSQRLFERVGFQQTHQDDDWLTYEYHGGTVE